MNTHNLELHIDELVLHDFENIDGNSVRDAVQRELTRLFVERGTPSSLDGGLHSSTLDGGSFEVSPDSGADAIGAKVAQALYRGFNQ